MGAAPWAGAAGEEGISAGSQSNHLLKFSTPLCSLPLGLSRHSATTELAVDESQFGGTLDEVKDTRRFRRVALSRSERQCAFKAQPHRVSFPSAFTRLRPETATVHTAASQRSQRTNAHARRVLRAPRRQPRASNATLPARRPRRSARNNRLRGVTWLVRGRPFLARAALAHNPTARGSRRSVPLLRENLRRVTSIRIVIECRLSTRITDIHLTF
jgi:hypothetical protein